MSRSLDTARFRACLCAAITCLFTAAHAAGAPHARTVPPGALDTATNAGMKLDLQPDTPDGARATPATESTDQPLGAMPKRSAGMFPPLAENITILREPRGETPLKTIPWYRNGLVSLTIVLAAIAAMALVAKRFLTPSQVSGATVLRVLCRIHVSPKQSIVLVQMGGRFAFVGVTPDRITPLHIVDDPNEAAALRSELRSARNLKNDTSFDRILDGQSQRMADHLEPAVKESVLHTDDMTRTREDLNGLLHKLRSFSRRPNPTTPCAKNA